MGNPGKFETSGPVGEWLHERSLEGGHDAEAGDVTENGKHYCLFREPFKREELTEAGLPPDDRERLEGKAAILSEDEQGFVDVEVVDAGEAAEARWQEIEAEVAEFYDAGGEDE